MKILVTGSDGFIGTNLMEALRKTGDDPVGFDLAESWDVRDSAMVADRVEKHLPDAIVHLAALSGIDSCSSMTLALDVNVRGTLNVLKAAARFKVKRVVVASSGSAANPQNAYAASKAAMEAFCSWFGGSEVVVLRFGNVYGPHSERKSSVVAAFCRAALEGQSLTIYGDGGARRDFVHVDDVLGGIRKALVRPADHVAGKVFYLGGPTRPLPTVADVVELVAQSHDDGDATNPIRIQHAGPRTGDVDSPASQDPNEGLGYVPSVTLEQGVRRTYDWFHQYQNAACVS